MAAQALKIVAHEDSLKKMGIITDRIVNVVGFAEPQREFLEFHRASVFDSNSRFEVAQASPPASSPGVPAPVMPRPARRRPNSQPGRLRYDLKMRIAMFLKRKGYV